MARDPLDDFERRLGAREAEPHHAAATRSSARVASPQGWSASVSAGSDAARVNVASRGSCAARVVRPSTSVVRRARSVRHVDTSPPSAATRASASSTPATSPRTATASSQEAGAKSAQARASERSAARRHSAAVAPAVAWTPGRWASRRPWPRCRGGRGRVEQPDRVRGVVAGRAHRLRERAEAGGEGVGGGRHAWAPLEWAPLALAPLERGREAGDVRARERHVARRIHRGRGEREDRGVGPVHNRRRLFIATIGVDGPRPLT